MGAILLLVQSESLLTRRSWWKFFYAEKQTGIENLTSITLEVLYMAFKNIKLNC